MTKSKPMMTLTEFFDWFRELQAHNSLEQADVDTVKTVLQPVDPADLQKVIELALAQNSKSGNTSDDKKRLSGADIKAAAKVIGVEPAALKSVIDVECPKDGFDSEGRPTILFEPHVYYRYLTKANIITKRDQLQVLFPDMLSKQWDRSLYNKRPSHDKLAVAAVLDWDAAHMSCSWGKGQVMGFNWQDLKYPSLKAFVDAMHESEGAQIDAMCRFIKVNGLVDELQRHDWAGFAHGYNGEGYKANQYDTRLAAAYKKAKGEGW